MFVRFQTAAAALILWFAGSAHALAPEVLEAASKAVKDADDSFSAMPNIIPDVPLVRTPGGVYEYLVGDGDNTSTVKVRAIAAYHATVYISPVYAPGMIAGKANSIFQAMLAPFTDACGKLRGELVRRDFPGWLPKDSGDEALSIIMSRSRSENLLGQHSCVVERQVAFAVALAPDRTLKGQLMPPGEIATLTAWVYDPSELANQANVAQAGSDDFEKATQDLRTVGRAGTRVQVRTSAVQIPHRQPEATWTCALLIDRKDELMQVQIGTRTVYVPSSAVVPLVTDRTRQPGQPKACSQLSPQ